MFNHLTSRDRRAILIGIGLLSPAIFYFLWLDPFITSHQQLNNRIVAEQANVLWMQQAAMEAQRLRQKTIPIDSKPSPSLLVLLDTQNTLNMTNKRLEPKNEQEVRIYFDEVRFTQLIPWLAQLYQQYQIQVTMISLERQTKPDTVKGYVTLYRPE